MLKPIDDSADVYSFGAIIYNILMGSYLESDERKIEDYEDFEVSVVFCGCGRLLVLTESQNDRQQFGTVMCRRQQHCWREPTQLTIVS